MEKNETKKQSSKQASRLIQKVRDNRWSSIKSHPPSSFWNHNFSTPAPQSQSKVKSGQASQEGGDRLNWKININININIKTTHRTRSDQIESNLHQSSRMSLPPPDVTLSPSAFTALSTGIGSGSGSGAEKDKATNTGTGTGAILSTSFRTTTQQKQEKLEIEGVAPGVQGNGEKEEVKVKKGITAAPKIMTPLEARMLQSAEVGNFNYSPFEFLRHSPFAGLLCIRPSHSMSDRPNTLTFDLIVTQTHLRTRSRTGKLRCLCAAGGG